jgi:hypothetical protein
MGGLSKKPSKPKAAPVVPLPDETQIAKARKRRMAQYSQGSSIMSQTLGG